MADAHEINVTDRARAEIVARLRARKGGPRVAVRLYPAGSRGPYIYGSNQGGGENRQSTYWLAFDAPRETDLVVRERGEDILLVSDQLLRAIDGQILDFPGGPSASEFTIWPSGAAFGFRPTVLVTGASGFIGSPLVRRLGRDRRETRGLVRSEARSGNMRLWGAKPVFGDVTDRNSLEKAMVGADVVVHLVAVIREKGAATFQHIDVDGTRNVVEAAKAMGARRFIHMSALGASPDRRFPYTYSKWQGEEIVRNSGLDWTILRPSTVFGEGFNFITRLLESAKILPPFVPVPGSGRTRFQPIWVEDVVSAVIACVKDEKFIGREIDIGGPEYMTFEEMLQATIDTVGLKRIHLHIPTLLMKPAVWGMEKLLPDPPVTPVELAMLKRDTVTELDSIERNFGFKPKPLREGLDYLKKQQTA